MVPVAFAVVPVLDEPVPVPELELLVVGADVAVPLVVGADVAVPPVVGADVAVPAVPELLVVGAAVAVPPVVGAEVAAPVAPGVCIPIVTLEPITLDARETP